MMAAVVLALAACGQDTPTAQVPATTGGTTPPAAVDAGAGWKPAAEDTLQVQFSGEFDAEVEADIYDLDLFDTEAATIAALHEQGKRVVCYISVGSWEDWRPDAEDFPEEVIGKKYEGWPGERWLDIRRIDLLAPILGARLDLCAAKGFDGVEPDNVQVHDNDTGFPITAADQHAFALWLVNEAHARGLAIGLKNAPDMAAALAPCYDYALVEDCAVYGWCGEMAPFIALGKPVFAIEYTDEQRDFEGACATARALGLTMMLKHRDLDAWREVCPPAAGG